MLRRIRPVAVIAISAAVGIVSIASRGIEPPGWDREANAREVTRIQWHLARVETELKARDPATFSPVQCANRVTNLGRLHQYRSAGRFPHNHDFPRQKVPYFQDRHGTPSELAYLMNESGRQDLVDRIAATDNNATVFEIANDPQVGPAVVAWLRNAGLTIEEAALIQSFYGGT